jgi:hypothetical protein
MRVLIRVILLMLGRAVAFIRANPDENPASAQVAARLAVLGERAELLAQQQRAGQMGVSAASNDKAERREDLQNGVGAVIGIARVAAKDNPDLTVHRRPLRRRVDETTLLTTARVVVAEAGAAMEIMAPFGLTQDLLDSITANVTAYEAAMARQRNALAAQVGAGAELDAVAAAIMDVVKNLDALYRVRFRKDPERMAAWKSARNVAWPGSAADDAPAPPAPATPDSGKAA